MAENAFGLASLYDPSIAVDQAALERQMQMAQALRQMSMAPGGQTHMAGQMAIKNSPLEGLAKILQGYQANRMDEGNDASRMAMSQKTMAAMAQLLRGDEPGQQAPAAAPASASPPPQLPQGVSGDQLAAGGFPQPPAQPQPPQPAAPVPSVSKPAMNMAAILRGNVVGQLGGPAMGTAYAEQFKATDFERTLRAAGIDPQSAIGRKLMQDQVAKQNNIPMESHRAGSYMRDPVSGAIRQLPQVPEGYQGVDDGRGRMSVQPVQGGPQAVQASAAAKALGGAQAVPYNQGVDENGRPLPVQSTAAVLGGQRPPDVTPQVQSARDDQRRAILQAELAREPDPKMRADIQKELDATRGGQAYPTTGAVYAQPPLGSEHAQKGMDTSWEALKAQNREAQNTKSYLQNIVTAAEKGAIVGPNADRREYIQGLFQLAGIKEDVNTNATSQTQLLDKYTNQIVARLGQGGLGTDAARAILQSAYPNKNMNVDAIREASANLAGASEMTQAKTRFLEDHAIKRDAAGYQRREIQFDQAADPRIWQYKSIRDPNQRKAFATTLIQQDPTFPDRIKQLEALGAL